MKTKTVVYNLCTWLSAVVLFFWGVPAQSREIIVEGQSADDPELTAHLAVQSGSVAPPATAVYTKTVEAATPFSEYRYFTQVEITNMPAGTFTWQMNNLAPDKINDLHFYSVGGDGCTQQSDLDIVCDRVSTFYLEYRYTNVYTLQLNTKRIGIGANFTGFSANHNATLVYIEPLGFLESVRSATNVSITPSVHKNHTLKWEILNTSKGVIIATFLDPRIRNLFLPLVTK